MRGFVCSLTFGLLVSCDTGAEKDDSSAFPNAESNVRDFGPSVSLEDRGYGVFFKFSPSQMESMETHRLEEDSARHLLENKFSLSEIRRFCKPENVWNPQNQSLVQLADNIQGVLYGETDHEFDSITFLVNDCGVNVAQHSYSQGVRDSWARWPFAVRVVKGDAQWVISGELPNQLMDQMVEQD